jgi:hypothetical protein
MYCFQFAVFLLALLLIQIAIGIFLFVTIKQEGWEQVVRDSIEDSFANYHNSTIVQEKVDNLQRNVSQCCMLKKYGPIFFSTCKGYPVQLLA